MSYTPTEWESADIVTATRINKLETAVGDMNMSYTPNTWSDGDILSADKMNALEQAVAEGGGGSSDFSTAEITFVMNAEAPMEGVTLAVPQVADIVLCQPPDFEPPIPMTNVFLCPGYTLIDKSGSTMTVPVYKGSFVFSAPDAKIISSSGCDVSGVYFNFDPSDPSAYFVVSNITRDATIIIEGMT